MRLTTKRLRPGWHRVMLNGQATALTLIRSVEPGKPEGWWVDDDRCDYLDRTGEPSLTLGQAMDNVQMWIDDALCYSDYATAEALIGVANADDQEVTE